jgi:hypothetical protein
LTRIKTESVFSAGSLEPRPSTLVPALMAIPAPRQAGRTALTVDDRDQRRNMPMATPEEQRERMVTVQLAGRRISDPHVLDAMGQVPREAFVNPGYE